MTPSPHRLKGDSGRFTSVLRDVDIRHVSSRKSKHVFFLRGYDRSPMTDVRIADCTFDGVAAKDVVEAVRGLTLTNVRVNGELRGNIP